MDLSIVVINKDKEKAVGECLEAIVKQKRKTDELIVIDDSSADASMQRIIEWKDNIDNIISFSSQGNRSKVRNHAANYCSKAIIVFVDSDVMIGPDNLDRIRTIHQDEGIVGTNGNVFGNNHDVEQFEFVIGMKLDEFVRLVKDDFSVLFEYESFFDHRYKNKELTNDSWDNWENYYTSFASVRRDAFEKVGGFDERIQSWGGEDSEFGYRINKLGRIVFDENIVSFHIPHPKNVYMNYSNFLQNMYYCLNKHRNTDYEIYSSFLTHDRKKIESELEDLKEYIVKETKNTTDPVDISQSEIYVGLSDEHNMNGRIVFWDEFGKNSISLMGFAMPFKDKTFETAYLSDKCHLLPVSLICKLFQEALRIAKTVYLCKNVNHYQRYVDRGVFEKDYELLLGTYYVSENITDFEIVDYDENYYRIAWKENAAMRLSKVISQM